MLQVVGDDADQAHGQRDGRVPTLVDDPSEVLVADTTDELRRAGGHGRVVAGQELSRGGDPTDLVRALAVSRLVGVEGEREPLGPPLLVPHLPPVERLGQMVVLDTAEVPYQPGDRVGLPVGPPSKDLVIGTVEDVSYLVAYPIECIGQDFGDGVHACIVPLGGCTCPSWAGCDES